MKEDYQEVFKKLTLFFVSNSAPFNGQKHQKQTGPGNSDESLFRLSNKFKKISFLSYVLSEDNELISLMIVELFQNFSNLCKPIHDIISYSTSICSFESGKCGKERIDYKKLNISSMTRAFSMKLKSFFIAFEGLSFGERIKI